MNSLRSQRPIGWILISIVAVSGCCIKKGNECSFDESCNGPLIGPAQLEVEDPNCLPCCDREEYRPAPQYFDESNVAYLDMSLQDVVQTAMQRSKVLRDLGGSVLRAPDAVKSMSDPAIVYTDPRFGEEAALSEFDATFAARAFFDKNDRAVNSEFVGDSGFLQQDLGNYEYGIRKRVATGTQVGLRHITDYDYNNTIGNRFGQPSGSWTTYVDAEVRHPLLQGGGILFNRIAGASNQPGVVNGVLIARTKTDISLAELQIGLRSLVSNIENAYWDLYFAYRDLNAKKRARDDALESWRTTKNKAKAGDEEGEADKLNQAEEQYWRFQAEVLDALNGRVVEGTRTDNGSSGGTFRASSGIRVAERRLRLIAGMPINGAELIRPRDEPTTAPIQFDWDAISNESINHRPEVRRQRWVIKQHELELIANKNFILPQLDAIGRYRVRGFGESLISSSNQPFSSAFDNLLSDTDQQEWQLGVEFSVPIGFRRAHSAVRNSELRLSRACAILEEQKRHVWYGLSNAIGDVRRAYDVLQATYNRRTAADRQVKATTKSRKEGLGVPFDLVLEAQRRRVEAEIRYFQARVDYAIAIKNVHFEKGTILAYCNVNLSEAPSYPGANADAIELRGSRGDNISYVCRDIVIGQRGRVGPDLSAGYEPSSGNDIEGTVINEEIIADPFHDHPTSNNIPMDVVPETSSEVSPELDPPNSTTN